MTGVSANWIAGLIHRPQTIRVLAALGLVAQGDDLEANLCTRRKAAEDGLGMFGGDDEGGELWHSVLRSVSSNPSGRQH